MTHFHMGMLLPRIVADSMDSFRRCILFAYTSSVSD